MLSRLSRRFRLYDILFEAAEDLRALPFVERRAAARSLVCARIAAAHPTSRELIAFERSTSWTICAPARATNGIEGLMLKRRDSPYVAGRPKGHWFKWKRDAADRRLPC